MNATRVLWKQREFMSIDDIMTCVIQQRKNDARNRIPNNWFALLYSTVIDEKSVQVGYCCHWACIVCIKICAYQRVLFPPCTVWVDWIFVPFFWHHVSAQPRLRHCFDLYCAALRCAALYYVCPLPKTMAALHQADKIITLLTAAHACYATVYLARKRGWLGRGQRRVKSDTYECNCIARLFQIVPFVHL